MGSRELTVVVLVVLAAVLLLPVLGMSMWGAGMMGRWMTGTGMMGYGAGFALLVLILLGMGVALLVTGLSRRPAPEDALGILKRRLAAGEISREQYEELKQVLRA